MKQREYYELALRLERLAVARPAAYRRRVLLLALLGYGYLLAVGAVAIAGVALVVLSFFLWDTVNIWTLLAGAALAGFGGMLVRSMWASPPPVTGYLLGRADAPRLFALVDEFRERLATPAVDRIVLNGDCNCAMMQIARPGVLGAWHNTLLVGLPLLQSLTPGQFRAVLAHEMGHLSREHGRFSGWIYRLRETWSRLAERIDRGGPLTRLVFARFLRWYGPYFNACTFALARANEYEADRCASFLTDARTLADALIAVRVRGAYVEDLYWQEVYDQAGEGPSPPPRVFSDLSRRVRRRLPSDPARRWYALGVRAAADWEDTHPGLGERIRSLGLPLPSADYPPEPLLGAVERSAADDLLPDQLVAECLVEMDQAWYDYMAGPWRQRYRHAHLQRDRLARLDERLESNGQLSPDDHVERIRLIQRCRSPEQARSLLRQFLDERPGHAGANFLMGLDRLGDDDPAGIELLQHAMAADPKWVLPGCEALYLFHKSRGELAEALPYVDRALGHAGRMKRTWGGDHLQEKAPRPGAEGLWLRLTPPPTGSA